MVLLLYYPQKAVLNLNLKQFGVKLKRYHVPRMVYVNKMDIIGADFYNVLKMMVERLNAHPVAIQIPIGSEDTFQGLIDLIKMKL